MVSKWRVQIVDVMIGPKDPIEKSMGLEVSLMIIVDIDLKKGKDGIITIGRAKEYWYILSI